MTATPSETRHRSRLRLGSMEVLGFFDDPEQASTRLTIPNTERTSTRLPSANPPAADVSRGRHERVTDDPVATWKPDDIGAGLLRGNVRWSLLVTLIMLGLLLGGAAVWLYQRPHALARQAVTEVQDGAQALRPELRALAETNHGLNDPARELTNLGSQLSAIDSLARDLFAASASLPPTEATTRSAAGDAVSGALDASSLIGDAHAFRAAVLPILAAPPLETDPDLISLEQAALGFGEWQAGFESVLSVLPTGAMQEVEAELEAISGELQGMLPRYLDALRDGDRRDAESVRQLLTERLGNAEVVLVGSLADVQAEVERHIERSLQAIELLLG